MPQRPLISLISSTPQPAPRPLRDAVLNRVMTSKSGPVQSIAGATPGVPSEISSVPRFNLALPSCSRPSEAPDIYGPTNINAQTASQNIGVAINDRGTLTVFRYPTCTHYDQLKYRTTARDKPRMGADVNAGAFLGLRVAEGDSAETLWLRNFETEQRYANKGEDRYSDTVITEHKSDNYGITVRVRDVTAKDLPALHREVSVELDAGVDYESVHLLAFENMNATHAKRRRHPSRDWCTDYQNQDTAQYDKDVGAVIHHASGVDPSDYEQVSIAMAMGFAEQPDAAHVGNDAESTPLITAIAGKQDAYEAAEEGKFVTTKARGLTNSVLAKKLDLTTGRDTARVIFVGARSPEQARKRMNVARSQSFDDVNRTKERWLNDVLGSAPMPNIDSEPVLELGRRSLATVLTLITDDSGAIPAALATQAPYAEDWPRDGAFFNYILDMVGLHDTVADRNRWYAETQSTGPMMPFSSSTPTTLRGNWPMNMYSDGTVSGPLPFEIDETGYTLWTMWDHYDLTGDKEYLKDVYPAIKRGGNFLSRWVDPTNKLHLPAYEDDNFPPKQSIAGAQAVYLGVDSAAKAAEAMGETEDRKRFERRRDNLRKAIDKHLWNPKKEVYGFGGQAARPELIWPVGFKNFDHPRMQKHAEALWEKTKETFDEPEAGDIDSGLYESKALISLGKIWKDQPEKMAKLRDGLRWIAEYHATDDTNIMGEIWYRYDNEIITTVSQPHCWEQVLFYQAALELYPPNGVGEADYKGTVGRLREQRFSG